MSDGDETTGAQPDESPKERVDRELGDHRMRFRRMDKERLFLANRLVICAAVLVAIGISLTVYLVVGTLVGGTLATVIATANASWITWFWFGLPSSDLPSDSRRNRWLWAYIRIYSAAELARQPGFEAAIFRPERR